jgi:predicted membrane-bound dolichyl-phosphate-mannose-protein mannosyltransferase
MYRRAAMAARLRDPLVLLAVLSVISLAARVGWLAKPCHSPCRSAHDRVLIFDERYYVNAARVIAGVRPQPGAQYASAPLGTDPNAEHPQLAKLIIAGSIELFGDGPVAWRLGSIVFGSVALLGLYALVRAAAGSSGLALGAAALMAADNLLLVHGRIATLDIYVLAAMIWGAAFYLRGRPIAAGAAVGVGACMKLAAPYVLIVLALLEAMRWHLGAERNGAARLRSLATCCGAAAAVFVTLLAALDAIAPPYDAAAGALVGGGPLRHLTHMLSYGATQSSPGGPHGIASYPWQWLVDYRPIVYLNINPAAPAPGLAGIHPAVHFLGMISPPLMLLALPALLLATVGFVCRRHVWPARFEPVSSSVALLGLAWFIGTFVPFELLSAIWSRTSYLYYMVIVMPGLYMLAADLLARARVSRMVIGVWAAAAVVAVVLMYPFTPLP